MFAVCHVQTRVVRKLILKNSTDADVHYRLRFEQSADRASPAPVVVSPIPGADASTSGSAESSTALTATQRSAPGQAQGPAPGGGGGWVGSVPPLYVRTADAENIVRYGEQREVNIAFESSSGCHLDTKVEIETKAGSFPIRIRAMAALPTIESEPRHLDFGVVAVSHSPALHPLASLC
jgi:hypothetical protein